MTAIQPYYTSDGRYITDTNQLSGGTTAAPVNFDPSSSISSLRQQIATGAISPDAALAQIKQAYITSQYQNGNTASNSMTQSQIDSIKSQLYAPLTINSGGKISQLNPDGSVSSNSTTINSTTVSGQGNYTTGTSYQTPGVSDYTVKSGDTLNAIAAKNGMSLSQLLQLNPQFQSNPNLIQPGQTVNLSSQTSSQTTAKAPDDPSYKYNTATGALNPKYNGGGTTQYANGLPPDDPSNKYNTATGQLNPNYNAGAASSPSGPTAKTYPSTGNANLDKLQMEYSNWITGSLASGFQVNPALSITPATVGQFLQQTASQLNPQLQQTLSQEIIGINQAVGKLTTAYQNSQSQTIQDFMQTLGTQRNSAGANGMYLGGGERAIENGLLNSANRSLSTLDANTSADIGSTLQAGGAAVGQGFAGGSAFGVSLPGVTGNASSFNVPTLTSKMLSLGGGDSSFSGSSSGGSALNFNYNPSTYQYGTIPGQYSSDFFNLLNQTGASYLKGQAATGNYNVTSSSGLTL